MKINTHFFLSAFFVFCFSTSLFAVQKNDGNSKNYPETSCSSVKFVKKADLSGRSYLHLQCENGFKTICWGSVIFPALTNDPNKIVWMCNSKDRYEFSVDSKEMEKFEGAQFISVCDAIDLVGDPLCKKHQ